MLRFTRLGLEMRAVTQNRAMAAAMGIRTARIDALTFGLGSGIAGMAGVALSQIDNVSPNLGQGYIIDSFMVVVFGGVGNLWGTLVGAFTLGIANKFLEPFAGAVLGKIAILVFIILFIQKRPARHVRAQGQGDRGMKAFPLIRLLDRGAVVFLVLLGAFAIAIPVLNLAVPPSSGLHVSTYLVALFGKYLCYALLALSIDLIWGYGGILSLGHGAFFALGGYAMGMYLMRQIGTRGVYGDPVLPDFMVFLNWKALPVYWYGFQHFAYAALMILLVPGLLAFVFGWFAFRSRVTGVYLSIITQAMTYALLLGFFRNDFGFGGNNGLTDFKDILGFNVQTETTRNALLVITCLALAAAFLICRALVTSKFGKVLVAIRDAEARTRFLGYRVEAYKLFVFTLSACMAGVAGALYVPQVGIINPGEFAPGNSIEAVIWVAVGGRGTLTGAVLGAFVVNYAKTYFTSGFLAPYWLFMLGGLFIGVTLLMPRGIIGTYNHWRANRAEKNDSRDAGRGAARGGVGRMTDAMTESKTAMQTDATIGKQTTSALLYLDGISVSFDGFKALNELSFVIEPGEMRAIIGPNGAGKTTMMDVITGKTRPDSGDVFFQEGAYDLSKLDETQIAELGIGRKFQKPTVFEMHTVEDNLLLALKNDRRVRATLLWQSSLPQEQRIDAILDTIRLKGAALARRRQPVARAEAVAGDRHAAGAGAEIAAGRRAGRRHDRRRDHADC